MLLAHVDLIEKLLNYVPLQKGASTQQSVLPRAPPTETWVARSNACSQLCGRWSPALEGALQ